MAEPIASLFDESVRLSHTECDVRAYSAVLRAITQHEPDAVINLAGVSNVSFVKDINIFDLQIELDTNLLGAFWISKAAITVNPYVTLIHIGSVAGKYGKPQHSGYCASKAGVISLVQSLGKEGYDAYCISPGRVDTKMREFDYPGENKRTRLTTQDIARAVQEILTGRHLRGNNLIIRKRGTRTLRRRDHGEPWQEYLNVRPLRPGETPIKDI
jgi:NAD(P)-dependent dehydrogenase (short-subunit alcohol dehydrogenase family)